MRISRSFAGFAAGLIALLSVAAPAAAHEGMIGEGGPFRVDVTAGLPAEIDGRFGNGELELHVPAGMEVVALGLGGEPFAKVDADGTMFGNTNSQTWAMARDADMTGMGGTDVSTDPTIEPDWQFVAGGGSLQYHDHRIHFMAASIEPALADGGVVAPFSLPFVIDGVGVDVIGNLVFDPSLDPETAEQLLAAGAGATTGTTPDNPDMHEADTRDTDMHDTHRTADMRPTVPGPTGTDTSPVVFVAIAAVVVAGAAVVVAALAGAFILRNRPKSDTPDSAAESSTSDTSYTSD